MRITDHALRCPKIELNENSIRKNVTFMENLLKNENISVSIAGKLLGLLFSSRARLIFSQKSHNTIFLSYKGLARRLTSA